VLEDFEELQRRWATLKAAVWAQRWALFALAAACWLIAAAGALVSSF